MDGVNFTYPGASRQLSQETAQDQRLAYGTTITDNFDDVEGNYSTHPPDAFHAIGALASSSTGPMALSKTMTPLASPHVSAPAQTPPNWIYDIPGTFESTAIGSGSASDYFGSPSRAGREAKKRSSKGARLNEFDELLLELKAQNPGASWAQIADLVQKGTGKSYQLPALQMRYKRIRQRLLDESMEDDESLQAAVKYWKEEKWMIISEKMAQLQSVKQWTPDACRKRWLEIKLQNIGTGKMQRS